MHARVFDHAGSHRRLRWRTRACCLPRIGQRRHPDRISFAAQWLACMYPCQRFTSYLAVRFFQRSWTPISV